MLRSAFIIFTLLLLNGCSTRGVRHYAKYQIKEHKPPIKKNKSSYNLEEQNWITKALYQEYKKWYRTPYKFGGINTSGIDCSSLIQTVYKDAFGITVSRTTDKQAKDGYLISKKSTKEGDLVLFKTGHNVRHAGIIIENDKFMHASKKNGVIISRLSNPYWKSRYWQSRRILP